MAALFSNQARGWGQNTTSYKFQVPVITSGLYLPSKPLLYRWKFLPILHPPPALPTSPIPSHSQRLSQFSLCCFHCWDCWVKVDVWWKVKCVSGPQPPLWSPPPHPFLHVKLPRGSRPLVWVYYQNILTKYWVSATRISCCGRLTEWPLSLLTLMQQRAALSGGNSPPSLPSSPTRGQQGTLEARGRSPPGQNVAAIWSVTVRTIISQSPRWKRTMCQKTRCTSIGAAPLNSLPPGSKNIIYILLFIRRQIFCGSAGTRFQEGVHVKRSAGLGCLHKSVPLPNESKF